MLEGGSTLSELYCTSSCHPGPQDRHDRRLDAQAVLREHLRAVRNYRKPERAGARLCGGLRADRHRAQDAALLRADVDALGDVGDQALPGQPPERLVDSGAGAVGGEIGRHEQLARQLHQDEFHWAVRSLPNQK